MAFQWKKWRPALVGSARVLGALVLAYLFILVLITASLQTSVSERLGKLAEPVDYSSGYAQWRDAQDNREALATLRQRERTLVGQIDAANDEQAQSLITWRSSMETFELLLRRLSAVRGCEFTGERPSDSLTTESVLSDLRACLEQGALSPAQRRAAEDALSQSAAFREVDRLYQNKSNEVAALDRQLERVRSAIQARSTVDPAQARASEVFRELAAFTDGRLAGAGLFGAFPPAVVHILLAFVSGLFGALLVTLVLVVYPGNKLTLATGGGYEARIFLGGLISICVFVVLGGGTAVLGTSGGFGDGEANFLAFCAIGILAGMFSDRVAQWLSGRADAFFSRDRAA
jgi:hypothetical protein